MARGPACSIHSSMHGRVSRQARHVGAACRHTKIRSELITVLGNVTRHCTAPAHGRGLTPDQLHNRAEAKRRCVAHLLARMCDKDAYVRCAWMQRAQPV